MAFIICIEDQSDLRTEISEILHLEGHTVVAAANGREGAKKATQLLPDLIVCDISMPDLDGYGVLDEVRANPQTSTTPFLFLTGKSSRQEMRTGIERGADDYLTKPFDTDELINAVNALLQKRSTLEKAFQKRLETLRVSISNVLPHELRTPLISVVSYGDLLQRYAGDFSEADLQEIGATLATSGRRLQNLIENYLLYSRLTLLRYEPAVLEQLQQEQIQYPADLIQEEALKKAAAYKRPDDLQITTLHNTKVAITDTHMRKLISEITDNAFKFSEANTPITIQTISKDNFYKITIHNQGRGMKPEQIQEIGAFMQFERSAYEQQGSGLGLAIAQLIAFLYNGQLFINGQQDQYLEVMVQLPLAV